MIQQTSGTQLLPFYDFISFTGFIHVVSLLKEAHMNDLSEYDKSVLNVLAERRDVTNDKVLVPGFSHDKICDIFRFLCI